MREHRIYGHRGAALRAPENTLAGLRRAHELGATAVEVDVQLTRDGVCVLIHDFAVERTTSGEGPVPAHDLTALKTLDAGGKFHEDYAGEEIPTLVEALGLLAELGLHVNLEIKPYPGHEERTARALFVELAAHWPEDREPPLVSSFQRASLAVAQAAAPDMPRALIASRGRAATWLRDARALDCVALHTSHKRVTLRLVRRVHDAGLLLGVFTVNEAALATRLGALGVDYLFTDAPDVVGPAFLEARG